MIGKIEFGRTGHMSTRVVFGAASLGNVTQKVADQTLEVLLRYGVNHIDTAASYGDAERRIAPWLKREPGRFFLATKSDRRDEKGAREELHRSLDRLGVDHVDLWQLHALADPIEWDQALSPEGALDAGLAAREEGLIKWIGVTGHGAQIAATHRRSLERFDFDSVLLPYNYITMQEEPSDIDLAVWWALGRPGIFLNSVGDVDLLPLVLDAAKRFKKAPADDAMQSMLDRSHAEPLFV